MQLTRVLILNENLNKYVVDAYYDYFTKEVMYMKCIILFQTLENKFKRIKLSYNK